jgi:LsmAD domain
VRALQAFVFDGADTAGGLDEAQTTSANGWSGNDMFAENERRFGITATFEESLYTTAIDNANISAEDAQRIADSIMSQRAATAHEREERGIIDDSGLSEEDKYGAVLRQVPGQVEVPEETAASPARPAAWDGSSPGGPAASPGPPGSAPAPGGGTPDASSERVEINAVRRKIMEGKSLKTAVPAELRTKYVNNASEVDALNLMPGSGSNKFRKDKVSNVAQSLDDFKTKRFSGSNATSLPTSAVAAAAGNEAANKPAPPADAGNDASSAAPAASNTFKMNPDAKPFSFNPKSAPFVPGPKKSSDNASTGTSEFGHHGGARGKAQRERGDGCDAPTALYQTKPLLFTCSVVCIVCCFMLFQPCHLVPAAVLTMAAYCRQCHPTVDCHDVSSALRG